ncbi:MAG: LamG domain-containing protein [Desulfamplus sp.]|nr:LamG domain-containing protein [Desulfamplus sp.]
MKKFGLFSILLVSFLLISAGIVQAALNDGLVAYYPFNGNANDESGNGNHGIVNGATLTADRFGNPKSAYSFDGFSNITISDNTLFTSNQHSIIFFVNAITGGDLVSKDGENTERQWLIGCSLSTQKMVSHVWTNNGLFMKDTTESLSKRDWHHIAQIWNGTNLLLYIDGELKVNKTTTGSLANGSQPIRIGGGAPYGQPPHYFNGTIDDVRIYNRALSEFEIKQLYNENEWQCPESPDDGFTQADLDEAVNSAIQACINDPASCGISTGDGGYTAADLDAKYKEGYNAGATACSNGSATPATISADLKIHIPQLNYVSPFGTMYLWTDFEYAGESNGSLIWKLTNYGQK